MKTNLHEKEILSILALGAAIVSIASLTACGKKPGNVSLQSAPLAGPNAAQLMNRNSMLASIMEGMGNGLMSSLLGIQTAHALSVSPFTSFKACNDTLFFIDDKGNQLTIGGTNAPPVGQGLLSFSPNSTAAMPIGSLNIDGGTKISEVDITFAAVPSICGGANYAVQFDPGTGPINITQNTAFKFKFSSPITINGDQNINLMFGAIVNSMISLGTGLNNSTIQNVAVQGAAQ